MTSPTDAAPIDLQRRWLCGAVLGSCLPGAAAAAAARGPAGDEGGGGGGRGGGDGGAAPLLAREWPAAADPAGFLVSEKLDGVRALWDGRQLRFRSGRPIAAPAWFTQRLPAEPLDGELWLGRGRFEALSGLVRRSQPDDTGWQALRYQVFELPAAGGSFAERAASLQALAARRAAGSSWAAVLQQPAQGRDWLAQRLATVLAAGGEGLMLHRADAPQASGRGPWLYKHKPLHDAEAMVLAHQPGHGRLQGLLGALQVRIDSGVELAIGTGFSDADRRHPPAVGERITFTHRGHTAGGVPRFASYLRRAPVL